MNYEVIALSVIRMAEDWQRRLRRLVVGVDLIDQQIGPFFQAFFKDVLLPGIIMTAATCDQQHSERFGCASSWLLGLDRAKGEGEQNKQEEKERFREMIGASRVKAMNSHLRVAHNLWPFSS